MQVNSSDNKNKIELSDEYATIYNSFYGNENNEPDNDVMPDSEYLYADTPSSEINSSSENNYYADNDNTDFEYTDSEYTEPAYQDNNEYNQFAEQDSYINYQQEQTNTYTEDDKYEFAEQIEDEYIEESDDNDSDTLQSSFWEYFAAKITSIIFRLKGSVPSSATSATMYSESEDLGREVSVLYAQKYYGSNLDTYKKRVPVGIFILLLMAYFSLGLPVPGTLNNIHVMACCLISMQLFMMLLCVDVFTNGVLNLFSGRIGADSLAVISCIITLTDALAVRFSDSAAEHIPLCVISCMSLFGILLSSRFITRAFRKTVRVPAIGKKTFTVTGETEIVGHDITLLKSTRNISGFVRRMEEEPIDENLYKKIAPFLLLISVILTVLTALIKKSFSDILFIFSAVFVCSVPFGSLIAFSLPFYTGAKRMFTHASAIAGWSGVNDIGQSKNLIVTDRDLFPDSSISIENVRIFADYDSKKVISYAATMIIASESSLVNAFDNLMKENDCSLSHVDNFEILSGGGFKGLIDGHVVVCGNTDLMRLLDIRLPFRLIGPRCVLLSIDGVLYGIFNINYSADDNVRKALVSLMRSNRHPVFATRDFNISPNMIKDIFDVATDGYDFPPYAERFPISMAKPAQDSKISAVICREGLGALTVMADTGRSIFVTSRINCGICIVSSFLAPILFSILLIKGASVGVAYELIYMLLFSLPIFILGITMKTPN